METGFHAIFHSKLLNGETLTGQTIKINRDLELVMLNSGHVRDVFRLTEQNRDFLREWLPWVDGVNELEDTSAFITGTIDQHEKGRGLHFLIEYQGIPAGVIGFHLIDRPNRNAEIGYWLGEEFTGIGLMTRSVKQLLRIGFRELNLNRIEIRCAEENEPSSAVAKAVGMVYEGTLREEEWLYDYFVDHAVYSMLRSEFLRTPAGIEDE